MNYYNSKQSVFAVDTLSIIGFQQVLSNSKNVFIWMKGSTNKTPHSRTFEPATTYKSQAVGRIYAKSVWSIESVLKHLRHSLENIGITEDDFINLQFDSLSDKWVTKGDGARNFLKAILPNPKSEVTGEYFNMQINQYTKTPESISIRAFNEANGNEYKYKKLLAKYRDKSLIRRYTNVAMTVGGATRRVKQLKEVYFLEDDIKKPVYEVATVILGEPNNTYVNYTKANETPEESLDYIRKEIAKYKELPPQQTNINKESFKRNI